MVALRRLTGKVDDFREAFAGDGDAVFGAGEDGGAVRIGLAGLAMEDEACTAFGAGMLAEKDDAGVGTLGRGAVAEPGRKGNAQGEFRRDGAHVKDDGAEPTRLKKEVGSTERLIEAGVQLFGRVPSR